MGGTLLRGLMGKNKELGFPVDAMKTIVIAFDVDGTLRNNTASEPEANEDIRTLLRILSKFKNTKIIVWSGSGMLYANQMARTLHINQWVDRYASKTEWKELKPDIVIDDIQDTAIGEMNLIVREK